MASFKDSLVSKAVNFATKAHEGQVRKYTFEPYISHPLEVARIVSKVPCTVEMLCAAILHDVCEDCGVSFDTIDKEFGLVVGSYVEMLTDVSCAWMGNRAIRKETDRLHTELANPDAKTIKLADLISNSQSILQHDRNFAKVYIKEKELLLEVLKEGDATLYARAQQIVIDAKKELGLK